VFTNLIKNAIQAIPTERKGEISIQLSEENNHYKIDVADNGIGINDEQKDKIFIPSFTTKNKGMGLGLAMIKNIVENVDGSISFTSHPNELTVFCIILPKAQ